jgi:hypothetical protein
MNRHLKLFSFYRYSKNGWGIGIATDLWSLNFYVVTPRIGMAVFWLSKSPAHHRLETGFRIFGSASENEGEGSEILGQWIKSYSFYDEFLQRAK